MNLKKQDIRLGQEISNKEEAIRKAGEILVENGQLDSDFLTLWGEDTFWLAWW